MMFGRRLVTIRRAFSSVGNIQKREWPFIERASLSRTLDDALSSSPGSIWWICGGKGIGKTESIHRAVERATKGGNKSAGISCIADLSLIRSDGSVDDASLSNLLVRSISSQLSRQLSPRALLDLLLPNVPDLESRFQTLVASKPLWAHYARNSKSLSELWGKIVTSSHVAAEILQGINFNDDPATTIEVFAKLLKTLDHPVGIALLHVEKLETKVLKSSKVLAPLLNPENGFAVIIECNDSLTAIWNICDNAGPEIKIVEISDFPREAVKAVFVPSLLSDDVHVNALYSICGGRVGLLEQIVTPLNVLNEEQRLDEMQQEQRYKAGKEARPSNESKELQISPLVYKREVAIRDALVEGVLKPEVDRFYQDMERMVSEFAPIVELESSMSAMEIRVLIGESVRIIASRLGKSECMPLPSQLSPLDIAHPVVLGLLNSNILAMSWLPFPRIVAESPLKLFLLDSWYSSQLEAMSLHERAQYNLILLKNRIHFERQLDKLGA